METKLLPYLLFIPFFASCGLLPPKWAKKGTNYKQAVAKEYHLSKNKFVYNPVIDTNAVYVCSKELVSFERYSESMQAKPRTCYTFIRFTNRGVALASGWICRRLENDDFNDKEIGQFCFYKIEDDKIVLESYRYDLALFEYEYGKVRRNGDIMFYKAKGRPWGTYTEWDKDLYRKTAAVLTTKLVFPE